MEYANELGYRWGMTSNGMLINDEIENYRKIPVMPGLFAFGDKKMHLATKRLHTMEVVRYQIARLSYQTSHGYCKVAEGNIQYESKLPTGAITNNALSKSGIKTRSVYRSLYASITAIYKKRTLIQFAKTDRVPTQSTQTEYRFR